MVEGVVKGELGVWSIVKGVVKHELSGNYIGVACISNGAEML